MEISRDKMLAPEAANTLPGAHQTKIWPESEEEIRKHFTSSCEDGTDFIKFENISDVLVICGENVQADKLQQKLQELGVSPNDQIYFKEFYKVFESLAIAKSNAKLVPLETEANEQLDSGVSCATSEGTQHSHVDVNLLAPDAANTRARLPSITIKPECEEEVRDLFAWSCEDEKDFIKFEDISDVLVTCGENIPADKLQQKLEELRISQDDHIYFKEFYKVFESLATVKISAEFIPMDFEANIELESGATCATSENTQQSSDNANMLAPEAATTRARLPSITIQPECEEEIRDHFNWSCEDGKDFIKFVDISDVLLTCGENVPTDKLQQKLQELGVSPDDHVYFKDFYKVFKSLATAKINAELSPLEIEANIQLESGASCATSEETQQPHEDAENIAPEATENIAPEATENIAPEATENIPPEATENIPPEARNAQQWIPSLTIRSEEGIREHRAPPCGFRKDPTKFKDTSDELETPGEKVPVLKLRQKLPEILANQYDQIYFKEVYKVLGSLATAKINAAMAPHKSQTNIQVESGTSGPTPEVTHHSNDEADKISPDVVTTLRRVLSSKIRADYEEEIKEHPAPSCEVGKDPTKIEDTSGVLETPGETFPTPMVPALKLRQKQPEPGTPQNDQTCFKEVYKALGSLATAKMNAAVAPSKSQINIQVESEASCVTSEGTQHSNDAADKIAPKAEDTLASVSETKIRPSYEDEIRELFTSSCEDGKDFIKYDNIASVLENCGERVPAYKLRQKLPQLGIFQKGKIYFKEFFKIFESVATHRINAGLHSWKEKSNIQVKSGASYATSDGTQHSYDDTDKVAFTEWVNGVLEKDTELEDYIPIDGESPTALFRALRDGMILCKLVNWAAPGTIDERAINRSRPNVYTIHENLTLALNSASSIGCGIVNIGPEDILSGTPHLVLGLLWQLIRIGLFTASSVKNMPGLINLLEHGEDEQDLMRMTPEGIVKRWVNYHLKKAGSSRRNSNFTNDLKDSEVYAILLGEICPKDQMIDLTLPEGKSSSADLKKRAEVIIEAANKMKCRRFIRARDIVHENARLNMAFLCNIFKMYPGLNPVTGTGTGTGTGTSIGTGLDSDSEEAVMEERVAETREEKTFRNWINSFGVEPIVSDLHYELQDGWVLLQVLKIVSGNNPDIDLDSCNKPPFRRNGAIMKRLENCNDVIRFCTDMNMSTVGIAGSDIRDGNTKLTLAIIWQIMKLYTLSVLQKCTFSERPVEEAEIIEWANKRLESGGKRTRFTGFTDPTIATGKVILDLIDVIRPKTVNYALVQPGNDEAEKLLNANYAISLARKIGAKVYALPEDIAEVKSRMVMTVFACLMAREMIDLNAKKSKAALAAFSNTKL